MFSPSLDNKGVHISHSSSNTLADGLKFRHYPLRAEEKSREQNRTEHKNMVFPRFSVSNTQLNNPVQNDWIFNFKCKIVC